VARLIYNVIMSLDGYTADASGNFDWAAPDEEVHAFVNDLVRPIGTYLYGRLMYETMVYWETALGEPDQPAVTEDFARIWHSADKIVYSTTLERATSAKTRIERRFELDAVRRLKHEADRDIAIGGPDLAANAIKAGLVDEFQLFATPHIVGGGRRALPDGARLRLRLVDERAFASGVVFTRYELSD
jgi:dihydrofolate reductase